MGVGGTTKRLRADPVVAVGTITAVVLALVLLAAGPIYSDAVAVGALRRSLADTPASSTVVELTATSDVSEIDETSRVGAQEIDDAFGSTQVDISEQLTTTISYELPDQASEEQVDIASLISLGGVEERIQVVSGRLPVSTESARVEAIVDSSAAATLGIEVGDRLEMPQRTGPPASVRAEVVGLYAVTDKFDAYWVGRDRVVEPLSVSPSFRTVTMLVDRDALLANGPPRLDLGLLAIPRFDDIELDQAETVRRAVSRLEATASSALRDRLPDTTSEFEVATELPSALTGHERTLTVARSVVIAVVVQLAVLAAFALVLVAGLGVDARRAEAATLRARGASPWQMLGQAASDAALVVVPAALAAPILATYVVRLLGAVGPIRSIELELDPRVVPASWMVVVTAAVVTVLLLAWPAVSAARAMSAAADGSGSARRGGVLQRSGIDLAMLVIAIVAYWQVRNLGDDRSATVRGRFGVDPLLVITPTLGLVAGSFLALRVVPFGARVLERLVARTTTVAPALAGWQVARRPQRYSRSALLLIMAIAIGSFAVSYEATWTQSQTEQESHRLGADGRMTPNARTSDSLGGLVLPATIGAIRGVESSTPVVLDQAVLPPNARTARFLAVDAARGDVFNTVSRGRSGLFEGLAVLHSRRPATGAIALPGEPTALEMAFTSPEAPPSVDGGDADSERGTGTDAESGQADVSVPTPPPPPVLAGQVSVLIRDGAAMLHRLGAGPIGPGRSELRVEFAPGDEGTGRPLYPLSIVGIEISTAADLRPSRDVELRLEQPVAIGADGARAAVPLVDTDIQLTTDTLGFLSDRVDLSYGSDAPEGGLSLVFSTGAAFSPVPVILSLTPRGDGLPTILPVLANSRWLVETDTAVGDVVTASFGRADDLRVEIAGAVDAVPGIDPIQHDGLIVDLPTLITLEQRPGQAPRSVNGYWFSVAADSTVGPSTLTAPPLEAVDAEVLTDRVEELTSNPPAVAAIGAFGLGFGAAAAFAIAGFVVTVAVSVRERRGEFAILRALGLSERSRRRWMAGEQLMLVILGCVFGTALGVGLSYLVLPAVSLAQDGSSVFPTVSVIIPWATIALLEATVFVGLAAGVGVAAKWGSAFGTPPGRARGGR